MPPGAPAAPKTSAPPAATGPAPDTPAAGAADAADEVHSDDGFGSPQDPQRAHKGRHSRQPPAAAAAVSVPARAAGTDLESDWERGSGGGGRREGWVQRIPSAVPIVAIGAALLVIARAVLRPRRGGGGGRNGAGGTGGGVGAADAAVGAAGGGTAGGAEQPRRPRKRKAGAAASRADAGAPAALPPAPEPPEPEPTLEFWATPFSEPRQPAPEGGLRPLPLRGLRLAVSEHVAVKGAPVGCGVPALLQAAAPADASSPAVAALQAAGAHAARHCSTQPLNAPGLGANMRNPAAKWRVAGGGSTGVAVAVARGEADVGVGSDYLGSVRLPASCMGLCSFVPTPGALGAWETGGDGCSGNGGGSQPAAHEVTALLSHSMAALTAVAETLKLPGNPNLRHELTQVVVAEDLFKLTDPASMAAPIVAVKKAILQWAGQEQAGSVQLLSFLEGNVSCWRELLHDADAHAGPPDDAARSPPVLRALARAADVLYLRDVWRRHGHLLVQHEQQAGPTEQQHKQQQGQQPEGQGAHSEEEGQQQQQQSKPIEELQNGDAHRTQAEGEALANGCEPAGAELQGQPVQQLQQPQHEQEQQQHTQEHERQQRSGQEASQPKEQQAGQHDGLNSTLQDPKPQAGAAVADGAIAAHGVLPPEALELLLMASRVTDAQESAARAMAAEVKEVVRGAVRRDVVVVAPIVPGPPPRLDAPAPAAAAFLRRSRHFAAITSLAGAPTATLPLSCAGGGGAPVALALFGQARSDQRLLAVAAKLLPIVQARRTQDQRYHWGDFGRAVAYLHK